MQKILIIGKIPPPIGGVTIHVSRLIQKLEDETIPFKHITFQKKIIFFLSILYYKVVHLHTSNPLIRFGMAFFCFFTLKKIIVTYHGNIGRFGKIYNYFDLLSIFFAKYPIVLNEQSYKIAKKINKNSLFISAFIAPKNEDLDMNIGFMINKIREKKWTIFSTNAYDVTFTNKQETYGISFLIDIFSEMENVCLIVSDPSGNYQSYIRNNLKQNIPNNIIFISYPHSYYELLKKIDVMIRATNTDGDSLSIKEALYLGKKVICSNVVSRPQGVFLYNYNDKEDLLNTINDSCVKDNSIINSNLDGYFQLIQLYRYLLNV